MVRMKTVAYPLLLVAWLTCTKAYAETDTNKTVHRCGHPQVYVLASDKNDIRDACQGIGKALTFFASHKLYLTGSVVLDISPKLPDKAPPLAAGIYSKTEKRIYLLSFAEFSKFKTWFKTPINRELYQSVTTHEMAHAISDENFKIPQPAIQAKEYLAYVTMFSTMSSPLRKKVLLAFPGEGFSDEYQISPLFYMFDPMMFGVQAYRHYMRLKNPGSFLQSVLSGEALVDLDLLY